MTLSLDKKRLKMKNKLLVAHFFYKNLVHTFLILNFYFFCVKHNKKALAQIKKNYLRCVIFCQLINQIKNLTKYESKFVDHFDCDFRLIELDGLRYMYHKMSHRFFYSLKFESNF